MAARVLPDSAMVEHNDVELAHYQSRAPGGAFANEGDAVWFATAIPAGRFNCILSANLAAKGADARIKELLAPYRRRGVPHGWVVGPAAGPRDLPQRLERNGLRHIFDLRGMSADLTRLSLSRKGPRGLTIEPVVGDDQLALCIETMSRGFNDPPEESDAFLNMEAALGVGARQPRTHFLGRIDGEPVGTSVIFVDGHSAGLYNVTTLAPWRGRGIGAAMTAAALRHGRSLGYATATLLSSPMGAPLYRALGFRDAGVFAIYGDAQDGAAHDLSVAKLTASGQSSQIGRPSKAAQTPRGSGPSARRGR